MVSSIFTQVYRQIATEQPDKRILETAEVRFFRQRRVGFDTGCGWWERILDKAIVALLFPQDRLSFRNLDDYGRIRTSVGVERTDQQYSRTAKALLKRVLNLERIIFAEHLLQYQ